jgi:hypothetical protein
VVDELAERRPVGVQIGERARRDPGLHRRLRHRRRDARDEARVERLGDDVLRTEADRLDAVGERHLLGGLGLGELGDGTRRGQLHLGVDGGRTHVQGAAKDEREAKDVVDLVRIVRAPGGDDTVGACFARSLGGYLGVGVGERQDQRLLRHFLHHGGLEHAAGRQAEEDVGAGDHLVERARARLDGETLLVRVHFLAPALVHHALDVGDDDVLPWQPHLHEELQAGERRRAGAGGHQLHLIHVLIKKF